MVDTAPELKGRLVDWLIPESDRQWPRRPDGSDDLLRIAWVPDGQPVVKILNR